ncbi:MAK10-like protein [Tanacetum coccineum]
MTNKIDTVLKAISDRIAGAIPSDTVKNPKLSTSLVLSARSYLKIDPQCSSHPSTSINAIKAHSKEATISQTSLLLGESEPFKTLVDLGSCVNIIPLYLFKKLNIELLEETDHIFRLANGTKSYPVESFKDVEVHIGKLKLLNDFYVIDMKKDPKTPLLVERGFLATANAVIDCRLAKIAVGEGITRKDFLDCHLPEEWEIARDVELNPFKDTLVFRRMVQFRRTSLTGFLAQNIRSSNAVALDSPYLLVLITGRSQSRQHESCKSPIKSLFDVGSRRISIIAVNTKEYHSDVLAIITRIMRRTY